jgi:hypothetical protein
VNQLIEIRGYTLKEDCFTRFHELMQEKSVPMLRAAGTDVVAAGPSLHEDGAYVIIRAYRDLAHRSQSQDAFYGSTEWLQGPREAVLACIENYTTVVLHADQACIDGLRCTVVAA